jgi:hypothetical protein
MWETFLYTTGDKLETPKCDFVFTKWIKEANGSVALDTTTRYNLHIKNRKTSKMSLIPQISTKTPYKYVGVQIAMDVNMKQQI